MRASKLITEAKDVKLYTRLVQVLGDYDTKVPCTGISGLFNAAVESGTKILPKDKTAIAILNHVLNCGSTPSIIQKLLNCRFADLPAEVRPMIKKGRKHEVPVWSRDGQLSDRIKDLIDWAVTGKAGEWADVDGNKQEVIDSVKTDESKVNEGKTVHYHALTNDSAVAGKAFRILHKSGAQNVYGNKVQGQFEIHFQWDVEDRDENNAMNDVLTDLKKYGLKLVRESKGRLVKVIKEAFEGQKPEDVSDQFPEAVAAQKVGKHVLILYKLDEPRRTWSKGPLNDYELEYRELGRDPNNVNSVASSETSLWTKEEGEDMLKKGLFASVDMF
jgi:hypothetical protein